MAELKINSITFIDAKDVHVNARNTVNAKLAQQIIEKLKELPAGKAMRIDLSNETKNTKFSLRRALQKFGVKDALLTMHGNILEVIRDETSPAAAPAKPAPAKKK